jgi:hypothetical protein
MLKKQERTPVAPDYVVDGKWLGFGFVAYPAEYGTRGDDLPD